MGFRLTRFVVDAAALPAGTQQLDEDFFLVPDDRVVVHGTVRFPDGSLSGRLAGAVRGSEVL